MKNQKNKPRPLKIGRRTGINVLLGKAVRTRDDGTDVFEDYWTDGDSINSDETTQSLNSSIKNRSKRTSTNSLILDSVAVSPAKLRRSSPKKSLNQRNEKCDDYGEDCIPERSRKSGVSKNKSLNCPDDLEKAAFSRSKLTQLSTPSKNRKRLKEIEINEDDSCEQTSTNMPILDSVAVSPAKLRRSYLKKTLNQRNEKCDDYGEDCILEQLRKSGVSKNKSLNCPDNLEKAAFARSKLTQLSSPSKNRKRVKEIEINKYGPSDSKTNPVNMSPRVLTNTSAQNRIKDFPLLMYDTSPASVSLAHEMESGKEYKEKSNSRLYETEGSPLVNGTSTESWRENGGEAANSYDNEGNLIGRSRVLSNSLEEGDQKNSAEGSSPLNAAKSPVVLKLKEKTTSRSDKSINRSTVLASCQKENKKKEGKRKYCIRKLPTALKRKGALSLENSSSETPCVQNREGDGHKRNSSEGRSSQQSASVNKSEILVTGQKENDQKSSIEKSPRTSESNMVQISNRSDLQMKAVSPTHAMRRKIHVSETAENDLQERNGSPNCVRRSSRVRFPPLASWRNERPKFVKSMSGEIHCVGVDKGQPEDDYGFRLIKRRKDKAKKQKNNINLKTEIAVANSGEKIELHLHRLLSTCEWTVPPCEDSSGFMISQVFSSRLVTFGFLDIASRGMKAQRFSPTDNAHFVVVKGVVDALINTTSFTFHRGDSFIVPSGTMYGLTNNSSSNALLHFCSFKIPFYKYQDI